jgi:hypothetical protein
MNEGGCEMLISIRSVNVRDYYTNVVPSPARRNQAESGVSFYAL